MEIAIFAESIDDISIVPGGQALDITLSGVDLSQLVREVGAEALLEEIGKDEIEEHLKEIENEDE